MTICTVCGEQEAVCSVAYFIPGYTAGFRNTQEVGKLCKECSNKILTEHLTLPKPDDAFTLENLLEGMIMRGKK